MSTTRWLLSATSRPIPGIRKIEKAQVTAPSKSKMTVMSDMIRETVMQMACRATVCQKKTESGSF